MPKSLLEQAKRLSIRNKVKTPITAEQVELVVAYLQGELSLQAVSKVLNVTGASSYSRIHSILLHGVSNGWIEIKYKGK